MRRIARFALTGAVAACLAGALVLAAEAGKTTSVGDLVKMIARAKKMSVEEVQSFLSSQGLSVNENARLTERLAADVLGGLGINVTARENRDISADQLERLSPVISLVTLRATASDNAGSSQTSGRDEVVNQGRPRPEQARPASQANVNAFETLSEDPRP